MTSLSDLYAAVAFFAGVGLGAGALATKFCPDSWLDTLCRRYWALASIGAAAGLTATVVYMFSLLGRTPADLRCLDATPSPLDPHSNTFTALAFAIALATLPLIYAALFAWLPDKGGRVLQYLRRTLAAATALVTLALVLLFPAASAWIEALTDALLSCP